MTFVCTELHKHITIDRDAGTYTVEYSAQFDASNVQSCCPCQELIEHDETPPAGDDQ